jgi:hypothetical protein
MFPILKVKLTEGGLDDIDDSLARVDIGNDLSLA